MVKENLDRNFIVNELWRQGRTVDEISFETGIPRSTVGYYIRKFNQSAKSGKPIPISRTADSQNEKAMAVKAYIKFYCSTTLVNVLTEPDPPNLNWLIAPDQLDMKKMITEPDRLDRVYKALMILKLTKDS